ncbi:hypothetical protein LCGC14_1454420 [marine sediment metagenome]|uniref:Uncharacterized protein n=1 Tax=marine sediment metagenome TaxID=412755 RepID=A0A0F9K362_9ZZZZ
MKKKKEDIQSKQIKELFDYCETTSKSKPDGEFDRGYNYGLEHIAGQIKKIIDTNDVFSWSKEEYLNTINRNKRN